MFASMLKHFMFIFYLSFTHFFQRLIVNEIHISNFFIIGTFVLV